MTKPLLDKLGGGRGNGRRGEHGHSEERVVRKSRLVPTPSLNKCARQDTGHPLATATPRGEQFLSTQNICLRLDSFLLKGTYPTVLQRISLQGICPGNRYAVATDSGQRKRSSGVPHHVTTSDSQPPSGQRVTRYPTGSNKTQVKMMAARGSSSRIPTHERPGVGTSQVLTSAPSDGDIGICVDHQTEPSIDDAETYRVNARHASMAHTLCG